MTFSMRASGLIALLTLVLVGGAYAEEGVLEDTEYRFRLKAPGPGWRVMNAEQMQASVPDAVAGMLGPGGIWCAVIAESAPDVELEGFARLVLDSMPLEQKQNESFEKTTFQGKSAYRFTVSGTVSEVHVRYVNTMFRNGDFVFQLIAWTAFSRARPGFHEPTLRAFTILPGKVTGRSTKRKVPDAEGVGWLVRDGVFKSAALQVAVEPRGGWRVTVGGELESMNADAEVGLLHSVPDVYMVLLVERAAGVDKKAFAKSTMNSWEEGTDPKPNGRTLKARIGTHEVTFRGFTPGANPEFEFLKAVFFQDDLCMQVLFWYAASNRKEALAVIPDGVASLKLLSDVETQAVAKELRSGPDPENQVGSGFSLRRGVYRDFEGKFIFRKPPGEYWRVHAGMGARARNADARIYMEHPTLGISGLVIFEPKAQFTADTFHRAVAGAMFGEDTPVVKKGGRPVTVDGGQALATRGNIASEGLELRYHLVTTIRNGLAYQVILYGLERNVRASTKAIEAVLGSFRFDPKLEAQVIEDEGIQDVRFGFAFKPGLDGFPHRDVTPPSMAAIGAFHTWASRDGAVMLLALCAMQPGQDADWFRNLMAQTAKQRFGAILRSTPSTSETTVAGLTALRQSWPEGANTNDIILVTRDRTFYALFLMRRQGFTPEQIKAITGSFRLLD